MLLFIIKINYLWGVYKKNKQMKKTVLIMASLIFTIFSCQDGEKKVVKGDNPLLKEFDTPYGIPPFDKIKVEHYKPAFEEAIKVKNEAIEFIISNKEKPTFENTIEAFERSGNLLSKISEVYYPQTSANRTKELIAGAKEISAMLTKSSDEIILNSKLFNKIKEVYSKKETLNLSIEEKTLLEKTYKAFANNGANLSDDKKEKLKKINTKLAQLSIQFGNNVQNEENEFELLITDKKDLSGLPKWLIKTGEETAKKKGKKGYIYTLHKPSSMPFLAYADNRELRKKMFLGYSMKGSNGDKNDNNKLIEQIIKLRSEKAKLFGFNDYTEFKLQDRMAKNKENIFKLIDKVWEPSIKMAKKEARNLQNMIDKQGGNFKLEPWDWFYYTNKLKKERYNLDEEELKPYFSLKNTTKGMFYVCKKLFGITFKDITKNVPTFNKDVSTYKVSDLKGNYIGIILMDFHPRETKRNGAWMTSYRKQYTDKDGKFIHPIISITCNFTSPVGNNPALLSIEEVSTYFHEMGHAVHGLLSKCKYHSLSGTSVAKDFVELPSQILENWATHPDVLKIYAEHYKNKHIIPKELVNKMKKAGNFNVGFKNTEHLAAVYLDLFLHSKELNIEVGDFEKNMMDKVGLIKEIIPRYRSTYFNHIFAGGYAVGYYGL